MSGINDSVFQSKHILSLNLISVEINELFPTSLAYLRQQENKMKSPSYFCKGIQEPKKKQRILLPPENSSDTRKVKSLTDFPQQ